MSIPTSSKGSKRTTSASKRTSASDRQAADSADLCPICRGVGYVALDVPVGHPDFGKAMPCQCREQERQERRMLRMQRFGTLETLERMTFDSFIADPAHLSPEKQHNLRRAYEISVDYAANPKGGCS